MIIILSHPASVDEPVLNLLFGQPSFFCHLRPLLFCGVGAVQVLSEPVHQNIDDALGVLVSLCFPLASYYKIVTFVSPVNMSCILWGMELD